jgi:hypothetical protein
MKSTRLRQPAISALAALLIGGAGIAFAGNGSSAAPTAAAPTTTLDVVPVVAPTATPVTPAEPSAEPVGPETDALQQGDQTTPDSPAEQAAEAPGTETETPGVEEPGDENLPGGGHADDPNDPNADHQFEGVE